MKFKCSNCGATLDTEANSHPSICQWCGVSLEIAKSGDSGHPVFADTATTQMHGHSKANENAEPGSAEGQGVSRISVASTNSIPGLPEIALAAVVGIVAVTFKFMTGGWFFLLALMAILAPALALIHVLIHAWSCGGAISQQLRALRFFSNAAFIVASLAQIDFDDHCGWYTFTALLSAPAPCLSGYGLFGRFHNVVVLLPLIGSWLLLVILGFPRRNQDAKRFPGFGND